MITLGVDVGGTGVKAAPVETTTGEMNSERQRIPTPQPSTPKAVLKVVRRLVKQFEWNGPIGVGVPAVVRDGVTLTAANIHKSWIGTNVRDMLAEATGCPVTVINDADAAGIAEMTFGAGKGRKGTVLVVTLGTGIGTALFHNGVLMPNTELGHIELKGKDAEKYAADIVRKTEDLKWKDWAERVDEYLHEMERLFWPELIVVGGGVSRKHDKFLPRLTVKAEVVPAQMLNEAGIIGAALAASVEAG